MTAPEKISSPDHPALTQLQQQLADLAPQLESADAWPEQQLKLCAQYGVFEWFLPKTFGGQEWSEEDIVRGYLKLSAACLTTTFVITQRMGACKRIAICENESLQQAWLPALIAGDKFATVGISHLTTSRRHLAKPVLAAEESDQGFVLSGYSPWVTGAPFADLVVTGATLPDQRQVLLALPTDTPGVTIGPSADLVGLSASRTGAVQLDQVRVDQSMLLAGPIENVIGQGAGAKTGGLQTSTLAIGLADAAIDFLEEEAGKRANLGSPAQAMRAEHSALQSDLLSAAREEPTCSNEALRTRANSLSLRAAQAALTAAKGAGYIITHPAGRWCREALFFLVWSCPQPVLSANLCELAGIASAD